MSKLRLGMLVAAAAGFLMLASPLLSGLGVLPDDGVLAQTSKKKKKAEEPPADPTKPDIVLVDDLTVAKFGGCNPGDALITGAIVFRNIGTRSNLKITKPLVAAYIPENLDMMDADTVLNSLDNLEVTSKKIELGKGLPKDGRGFNKTRKVLIVVDPYNIVDEGNERNNIIVRDIKMNCK
jgi:hypothetical protein